MVRYKFMQTLEPRIYRELKKIARKRGCSVQEIITVELIPTFLYGPIIFDKRTLKRWNRIWNGNGNTGKVHGKKRLPTRP